MVPVPLHVSTSSRFRAPEFANDAHANSSNPVPDDVKIPPQFDDFLFGALTSCLISIRPPV